MSQTPLLVGREKQISSLEAALDSSQPKLIILNAEPGFGKTTLLRVLADRAEARQWRVSASGGSHPLEITRSTTEAGFCKHVRDSFALVDEASLIESPRNYASIVGNPSLDAGDSDRGTDYQKESTGQARSPISRYIHPLVGQLRRRAPLVLSIDGYQPSSSFERWFTNTLLPDIRTSSCQILTIVAARPRDTQRLASHADEVLSLGHLDKDAVRKHFEELGTDIQPPLTDQELVTYSDASCREPEILSGLTRLLSLTTTTGN